MHLQSYLTPLEGIVPTPTILKRTKMKGEGIFIVRSLVCDNGKEFVSLPRVVHNLVVKNGRDYYARMTAGVIHNFILSMKLGTDPLPSTEGDVDLHSPIWPAPGQSGQFDSFSFPATGQVTFVKRITGNEFGQEYTIREMSAHFDDGSLFDRSITGALPVHPTNIDNVEVGVIVEWSILF